MLKFLSRSLKMANSPKNRKNGTKNLDEKGSELNILLGGAKCLELSRNDLETKEKIYKKFGQSSVE